MKVPILRLRNVLLTSIQVDLSDEDALQFQADVLDMVQRTDAAAVVIDITGLDVVDSFMARVLNETATMAGLLGTRAVICGMRPSVALTLVEMGRELIGVQTAINLDQAMDKVRQFVAQEGTGRV